MGLKQTLIRSLPIPVLRVFASPYIAGDSEQDAVDTANWLNRKRRLKATIDLLGEELTDPSEVERSVQSYLTLLQKLGRQDFATVSLKVTQMGSLISAATCRDNVIRVAEAAAAQGTAVTLDMEDHTTTDQTLELYRELLPRFPDLGTVLQTRLHRTTGDIESFGDVTARFRLCIGIYQEPEAIALTDKDAMKQRLLEQARALLDAGHYVELATHDEALIERLLEMLAGQGVDRDRYEFQMLLGVPRSQVQTRLRRAGHTVRLYVPYAQQWRQALGYAKRRLAANPAIVSYGARNFFRQLGGRG